MDTTLHSRQRSIEQLRLLGVFHYVLGGLNGVMLLFVSGHFALMFTVLSTATPQPNAQGADPGTVLTIVGAFYGLFGSMLLAGLVLNWLAGRWLRRQRHRRFCVAVAALNCLQFPLGTVLGTFTLVTLKQEHARVLFDETDAARGANASAPPPTA